MEDTPNRRIGSTTGLLLILFALAVDIVQLVIDIVTLGTFGIVVNRIIDVVMAMILAFLLTAVFKVSFNEDPRIYLMFFATIAGEALPLPFIDAAPFWTFDAWYIVRTIQKKDAERMNAEKSQEKTKEMIIQEQIAARDYRASLEAQAQSVVNNQDQEE